MYLDSRERAEISKTRKRANLLKKKVLSAGNLGPKQEKGNSIMVTNIITIR